MDALPAQIERAAEERIAARPQAIPSTISAPFTINYNGKAVVLPNHIDDLEAEHSLEVYRRMETEYAISSSAFVFMALVLSSGWSLGTAVEEPAQDVTGPERTEYDEAEKVRLYNVRCLERMDTPLTGVLADACEFWGDGHKLFEQVPAVTQDPDGEFIQIVALKPKPRTNYRMAVTKDFDLLGAVPGKGGGLWVGTLDEFNAAPTFVEASRLLVVSNMRGADGNPQGRAAKRACYDPWNRKQRTKPESLRHATLFGSGRISIEGPAPTERTPLTPSQVVVQGKPYDLVDWLALQAQQLVNGSYLILPDGWKLMVHPPQGNGEAFEKIFDRCDREMIAGFLGTTRATSEAEHGSKADSQTALSVLVELVNYARGVLCQAFRSQFLYENTLLRYGKEIADKWTPKLLMAKAEQEDVPALLTALAAARTANVVMDDQLPYWDRKLGQPERDVKAMQKEEAEKAKAEAELDAYLKGETTARGESPKADQSFRRRAGQTR